jgi:uncharacterized OsmC-like protein
MAQADVKAAVMKSIEAIQANPKASKIFFKANTELQEDVRCLAKVRTFEPMVIDEPPELGGQDAGPNPVELLLVALGTCQEIVYSAYAAVMGVKLDSVKVSLRGDIDLKGLFDLDDETPAGYTKIRFETNIESDADEETLKSLIETVEAHCPVMDSLTRPVHIEGTAKVNGKALFSSVTKQAV